VAGLQAFTQCTVLKEFASTDVKSASPQWPQIPDHTVSRSSSTVTHRRTLFFTAR